MHQGYLSALYVDDGAIVDGELQPAFDQLLTMWADHVSKTATSAGADLTNALKRAGLRNPDTPSRWKGSKVDPVMRAKGLEPIHLKGTSS